MKIELRVPRWIRGKYDEHIGARKLVYIDGEPREEIEWLRGMERVVSELIGWNRYYLFYKVKAKGMKIDGDTMEIW